MAAIISPLYFCNNASDNSTLETILNQEESYILPKALVSPSIEYCGEENFLKRTPIEVKLPKIFETRDAQSKLDLTVEYANNLVKDLISGINYFESEIVDPKKQFNKVTGQIFTNEGIGSYELDDDSVYFEFPYDGKTLEINASFERDSAYESFRLDSCTFGFLNEKEDLSLNGNFPKYSDGNPIEYGSVSFYESFRVKNEKGENCKIEPLQLNSFDNLIKLFTSQVEANHPEIFEE